MTIVDMPSRFDVGQNQLLDRTIDDLLLRLRGLVLVAGLLERRGASAEIGRAHV